MKNEFQDSTQPIGQNNVYKQGNRKKPFKRRKNCGCGVSKEFRDQLQKKSASPNSVYMQPTNHLTGVEKEGNISKEFEGLPIIPAKLLEEMNVDINTASAKTKRSIAPKKLTAAETEVLRPYPIPIDEIISKDQKNLKEKIIDLMKRMSSSE